jgi:hypothetical protein
MHMDFVEKRFRKYRQRGYVIQLGVGMTKEDSCQVNESRNCSKEAGLEQPPVVPTAETIDAPPRAQWSSPRMERLGKVSRNTLGTFMPSIP